MSEKISLTINGRERSVVTEVERPLLDVLREDLQLTGAKYGCGEGRCGACTVLVDGKRTFSCRMPIGQAAGKTVLTIEGLGTDSKLHLVQEAFLAEDAYQCGYCIPGMILSAVAFLREKPKPSDEEIVSGMNRNLCRCCGYDNVVRAVRRAAAVQG